ncbi:MAG: helix-turn-helix domain-containing protein [Dehalococcoidales bacterium]|nr:helix-turn-helix domain-containing protein [Dehalococcoidales bacterium]
MKTFAELLTTFIRQAGITDSELARSVGVSRQTIFRWREGLTERPNKREDVTAIADKLRLTPEERNELLMAGGFRPEIISESSGESTDQTVEVEQRIDQSTNEHDDTHSLENIQESTSKKPFIRVSKRLLISAALLIILIPTILWLVSLDGTDNNVSTNQSTSSQTTDTSTPTTISPATSGEILILVSPFCVSGHYTDLSDKVITAISREGIGNRISNLRVEALTEIIDTFNEAEDAGKDKNASLVLFGECQSDNIKLQIIPATGQTYPVMEINGSNTISVNVVSMITLAKACIDTQQEDIAFSLLSKARNSLTDNAVTNESLFTIINTLLDETGIRSSNN